jgi:hypothetical protein
LLAIRDGEKPSGKPQTSMRGSRLRAMRLPISMYG